jgi:HEAT repeat protein
LHKSVGNRQHPVIVALGKLASSEAREALVALLQDENVTMQLRVSAALVEAGDPRGKVALLALLNRVMLDQDSFSKSSLIYTTARLRDSDAINQLLQYFESKDPSVRWTCAEALSQNMCRDERIEKKIAAQLTDTGPQVASVALLSLGRMRNDASFEIFQKVLLNDKHCRHVPGALALMRSPKSIDCLLELSKSPDAVVRAFAVGSIRRNGIWEERLREPLRKLLDHHEDAWLRAEAASVLLWHEYDEQALSCLLNLAAEMEQRSTHVGIAKKNLQQYVWAAPIEQKLRILKVLYGNNLLKSRTDF